MFRTPMLLPILFGCHASAGAGDDSPVARTDSCASIWTAPAPRPQVMVPVQETPPSPPIPPPSPEVESEEDELATPDAPEPRTPLDVARELNELTYEDDYLRVKERLVPEQLGRWIGIVGGRIVPEGERGKFQPAETFEACIKAADAADREALHRFIFRIGEEGDVIYADVSSQPRTVIGGAFRSKFGIAASFDARAGELKWTRAGKSKSFKLEHDQFELLLADPSGRQSMGTRLSDSSSFAGFVALDANTADLLDSERFEIPGRVLLRSDRGVVELRRTRVRIQVKDLDLDELVPAAAWVAPAPR